MGFVPALWRLRNRDLTTADHTLIMGIVNATPDSFSDGGRHYTREAAVAHGLALHSDGADIIDVGGESTRPGAGAIDASEEMRRVVPVVAALAEEGVVVSIDTSKPEVAEASLDAGAEIVNDVTGLRSTGMIDLCVASQPGVVIMHMQGEPRTMQTQPTYDDVVAEVGGFLRERATAVIEAGVDERRICLDPGIGFGKTFEHNLDLLGNLTMLVDGGRPVLVGTSRKGFLGEVLRRSDRPWDSDERMIASVASVVTAVAAGAAVVRVHDVESTLEAARTADAIVRASRS